MLTDEERRVKIQSLLAHRHRPLSALQLPTTRDYDNLATEEALTQLAHEMCRSLGFKPNGIKVVFGTFSEPSYKVIVKDKQLTLSALYRNHPYTLAGLLAMAVCEYFIEHFDRQKPDQALVEFATIEAGLGLWVCNALKPKLTFHTKLYHLVDSNWFHVEGLVLTHYTPLQFMTAVTAFAQEHRVLEEEYVPHILERCRYLLPTFITSRYQHFLPESSTVVKHHASARQFLIKLILLALIFAAGISFGIYTLNARQDPNAHAKQNQLAAIAILKESYDACQKTASEQQSKYDPNDLFLTRQVDATKARCESLRNEYNTAINDYDALF